MLFTNYRKTFSGALILSLGIGFNSFPVQEPAESSTGVQTFSPVGAPDEEETPSPCGKEAPQIPGSSAKHTVVSDERERDYILTLPENYEDHSEWPLIVAFHGRGSTGVEVEGYSRLSDLPAVVAYPFGEIPDLEDPRRAWQGAPYSDPEVNDVAFAEDLIDTLDQDLCIDAERIFATGKSNGGGLAIALGCQIPERIAAVAAVAPALYPGAREGCLEQHTASTMIIHGTEDSTIPYRGDADRDLPNLEDWSHDLAASNGCESEPAVVDMTVDVQRQDWQGCTEDADVALVSVDGGGHVWPGASAYSGGGFTTRTISGKDAAWDFFMSH